ncbi:MAG: DUF5320 family protein [Bacteroidales bacterium]|jgi:hypothetical protein|nr:DUF5320 family protein [Bacteroidales bacterium]
MPNLDGTGPEKKGTQSGRALGTCNESLLQNADLGKGQGKRRKAGGGEGQGKRLQSGLK